MDRENQGKKEPGAGEGKNQEYMERQEEVRSERIELRDGCRRLWASVSERCDGTECCGPCWTIFVDLSLFSLLINGSYR